MDNGLYVMTTRQLGLFRNMEVTANNLANANTTGYNAEHLLFAPLLKQDNSQGDKNKVAYSDAYGSWRDTTGGSLKSTGNPLDMAIQGKGYFQVETPLGVRYTRAGSFSNDGNGFIINAEGFKVLDQNQQPIQIPEDAREITLGENGLVKVNGQELATIGVVQFANEQALTRTSGTLLRADATPEAATDARVVQGALESSNVQPITELTNLIDISRSTGDTAKYIEMMYDLQRKANEAYAQAS